MKSLLVLMEMITAPSSVLDAGTGAGAEGTGGGGISFLPGFSLLSISGAKQKQVKEIKRGGLNNEWTKLANALFV